MGFNANLNCIGRSCYSRFDVASQDFIIEYSGFIDGNNNNNVKLQYRLKPDNSIVIHYDTITRTGLDSSFRAYTDLKVNERSFTVLSNTNFPYSWASPELTRNTNSGNHYSNYFNDRIPSGLTYTWTPTASLVRDIALLSANRIDSLNCGNLNTPITIKIRNEGGEVLSNAIIQFTTFRNDSLISTQNIPVSFNPIAPGDTSNILLTSLNLTIPGSYILVLEALVSQDDNNTNNRITLNTIVNPISTTFPLITNVGSTAICEGSEVILTSTPSNYYLWSNGATTRSITARIAGNYTVQTANNIYCLSAPSAPVAVTFIAPIVRPTITANGPTTFCSSTPVAVQLTSSAFHRNLWSTGDTTRSITVLAAGSYSVITQGALCSSLPSDTVRLTYFERPPRPTILTSGPTSFCLGNSVILSAPAAAYYRWNNGATTRSITIDSSGSFFVEVANYTNCYGPASLPVTVSVNSSAIAPTITALGSTEVCAGDSVVLRGPDNMAAYIWSSGENIQSITVFNSGNYTLQTIPVARGCISPVSSPITVTVAEIGVPPILYSSNADNFCQGDSSILSSNETGRRIWNTGDTTETLLVRTAGVYTVQIISVAGCTSATSEPIFITITARPTAPRISFVRGALVASGSYDTYVWYLNGEVIIGADSNRFTPTERGAYSVQGISDICNSEISASYTFDAVKGSIQFGVSIYPNPATNTVYVSSAKPYIGKVEFGIYNALGQEVLSKAVDLKTLETNAIDISAIPAGMYQYKLVLPVSIQQGALIIKK